MTAGTAAPRSLPSASGIARARVGLELKLFFRDRQQVIFTFLYPMIMMAIFGSVFRHSTVAGGVAYTQYFLAGIAATGIMLTTFQTMAITIAVEREDGTLARLQALPMPPWTFFAGKVGQVLVSTGSQLVLLLAVARWGFDVPLPRDAAHWVTFAWVVVLGTVAGTVIGVAASTIPNSGRAAGVVIAPIALVLEFFSGVFFVYTDLPGWMQDVAALFPLKWVTQGMRSALLPDRAATAEAGGSWEHVGTAVVLVVWILIALAVGLRTFKWRRR